MKGQQCLWDRNLGCLAGAYCASCHEATGFTPNLFGREMRLPVEVMFGSGTTNMGEDITSHGDYVNQLRSCNMHMNKPDSTILCLPAIRETVMI